MAARIPNAEIKLPKLPKRAKNFKGSHIFDQQWWNALLVAKRRKGKTTVVANLIDYFANPKTKVVFFVSTFHADATYRAIEASLNRKKIPYKVFLSTKDEHGTPLLRVFMDQRNAILEEAREKKSAAPSMEEALANPVVFDPCRGYTTTATGDEEMWNYIPATELGRLLAGAAERPGYGTPRREKKIAPEDEEFLFVFDDLGDELNQKQYYEFIKRTAHYKVKTITATQGISDTYTQGLNQMSYIAIFGSSPPGTLEKVVERSGFNISMETVTYLYNKYTRNVGDFILFDTVNGTVRYKLDQVVYRPPH